MAPARALPYAAITSAGRSQDARVFPVQDPALIRSPAEATSHEIAKGKDSEEKTFHELRHSCASLLLNNGFTLKVVQVYLVHSGIQVTADIYGHLDTSRKDMSAKGIENCIF